MIVKSLFDGISCGMVALEKAGIEVSEYSSSEIDKHAIKISNKNYPSIIRLGCIKSVHVKKNVDLILAGSPCQGFSRAGNGLNFNHEGSKLFFEFVRILNEAKKINPNVLFLLENVIMKKEWQNVISECLGVEPIEINSSLLSAQNRRRLYWTNIQGIISPEDKNILLKDILESNVDESYYLNDSKYYELIKESNNLNYIKTGKIYSNGDCGMGNRVYLNDSKSPTLNSNTMIKIVNATKKGYIEGFAGDGVSLEFPKSKTRRGRVQRNKSPTLQCNDSKGVITNDLRIRKLTPIEFERLQTLEDNYTSSVSKSQRYKMIGNSWTVEVIAYILSFIDPCQVSCKSQKKLSYN